VDILILLAVFTLLCAIGVPVAFSLGLSALIAAFWIDIPLEAVMLKISDGVDNFSLLAIPFFVLAGAIMAEGGMARRLVNLARVFVGWIRGGLALVNIVASTLFGCISGSSVADTASIGSVMIPEMIKRGYPRVFATNITICGSVQAIVLPPSHNSVIYSIAAGGTISIAHLFMAGIFPGLLFGLCLVVLVLVIAKKRNFPRGDPISLRDSLKIALDSIWGLVTIVIILGGILSGVFTATESAAVACIYAFLVTMFVYRDCKWSQLPHLVHRTVKTVAMVMMLIGFSVAFGYLMALMQLPAKATAFFLTLTDNKYVMLLLVNILLANGDAHLKNWSLIYPDADTALGRSFYAHVYPVTALEPGHDPYSVAVAGDGPLPELTVSQTLAPSSQLDDLGALARVGTGGAGHVVFHRRQDRRTDHRSPHLYRQLVGGQAGAIGQDIGDHRPGLVVGLQPDRPDCGLGIGEPQNGQGELEVGIRSQRRGEVTECLRQRDFG